MLEVGKENLERNMEFESTAKYMSSTAIVQDGITQVGWCDSFDVAGC